MTDGEVQAPQRIDRWLWHARFARTRALAARIAASGTVRVNRTRVAKASHPVRAGDVIAVAQEHGVRVVRVVAMSERRLGAEAARALYEEMT